MNRIRSLSLGTKLNIALLAFLLILAAAMSAIIVYGFNRTRDNANARTSEALEQGGSLALRAVSGGAAEQGGILFESVGEIGQRSALYLTNAPQDDDSVAPAPELVRAASGHLYDPNPDRVTDLIVVKGASPDSAVIQEDIAFSAKLDTIFPVLLESIEGAVGGGNLDPTAGAFISTNGVARYYPPIGVQDRLPADVNITALMTEIGPEQNPGRQTIWTAPYEDAGGQGLVVTAETPVYVGDQLRGMVQVDVPMANVIAQINQIRPTDGGFAVYMDSSGNLMPSDSYDRIMSEAETNPEVAALLEAMRTNPLTDPRSAAVKLTLGGEEFTLSYARVPGLGGTLAVASPISDITAAAAPVASTIDDEGTRTLQVMLAAMAILFAAGLLGAAFLNRRAIIRPIDRLVLAARAVGAGDLDARVPVSASGDEFAELGVAFNSMVEQLRESERALEGRVEQRTRELTTLLEVSRQIAAELSLDELVQTLVRGANELFDTTGATIASVDPDGNATFLGSNHPELAAIAIGMRYSLSEAGAIWDELRQGRGVVMGNVRGDDAFATSYQHWMGPELKGVYRDVRSWMGVPFMVRGRLIGWMAVSHNEPNRFEASDLSIAMAMGSQAAVAFENARLYDEAIQRTTELNTLLMADSELHRSLSLDTVLEALVDVMMESLKADKCIVTMRAPDGEHLEVRAQRSFSPESIARFNEVYAGQAQRSDPIERGAIAHEDTSRMAPAVRAILEVEGVCSTLDAPIFTPDGVAGGFDLGYATAHTFTPYELRLAEAITERAGVAIRNAQLVDEAARRARETETLVRADAELFRSLNLETVLQALVDVAVDVVGVDTSLVTIWDRDAGTVEVRASRNLAPGELEAFKTMLPPAGGMLPDDVEPNVYESLDDIPEAIREVMRPFGKQAAMDVPIRSAAGEILGGYGVGYTQPHVFTADERRLLFALADRAAVAIQNAALYERAQQVGSLEERQRLARELHDSVSQALYGIALGTRTARLRLGDDPQNAAEPIDYVASLAQAGLAEMRALIFELRPESLEQEGLIAAIEKHAASTRARYGLDVRLDLMEEPECSIEVKEALYRIAQEALHNVVKHANALHVDVTLRRDGDFVELTVEDDGQGFDAGASFPGHVGLQSMPERAGRLGGTVEVTSERGNGTRVTARLPA